MSLAIVIPAYKLEFLEQAIDSIISQTNNRYRLYIFNDDSPFDLDSIINKYTDNHNVLYHKFDANLGKKDLIKHWNRCIDFCKEEWVWLFSDDDYAAKNCVEEFYTTLSFTDDKLDLYKFQSEMIDSQGVKISTRNKDIINIETNLEFLIQRLKMRRLSFVTEYVFRRKKFKQVGEFVNFPKAWCSDDATWIKISEESGIYSIKKASVYWRKSDQNISAVIDNTGLELFSATLKYIFWLRENYYSKLNFSKRLYLELLTLRWFIHQINYLNRVESIFYKLKFFLTNINRYLWSRIN